MDTPLHCSVVTWRYTVEAERDNEIAAGWTDKEKNKVLIGCLSLSCDLLVSPYRSLSSL